MTSSEKCMLRCGAIADPVHFLNPFIGYWQAHRRVNMEGQLFDDDRHVFGPPGALDVSHDALDSRRAVLARPQAAGHVKRQAEALQPAGHRRGDA